MSAGLASALEISAKIIREGQGTDMKESLLKLAERARQAKETFQRENNVYTYGMVVGFCHAIISVDVLLDATQPPESLAAR